MFSGIFSQAIVYLAAAVLAVPLAKRLGLGSALGYLLAGVIIGPFALGLVGEEGQDVMHFAEFGVVLMLFLVGLELEPAVLWRMRGPILGLGGSQVVITALVTGVVAFSMGLEWQSALAIGLILSLSSTAIVLQTLKEKGWMKTDAGRRGFSVLLFQDIAVIPILAVLPFLTVPGLEQEVTELAAQGADPGPPGWLMALEMLGVGLGIIVGGSGNEAIVANRLSGIRCAVVWNERTARLAREHGDCNMIAIGQRLMSEQEAVAVVDAWLTADFKGGRHQRRIDKIDK